MFHCMRPVLQVAIYLDHQIACSAVLQTFVRKLSWAKTQPMSPAQRTMLKTRGNILYIVLQYPDCGDMHAKKSTTESILLGDYPQPYIPSLPWTASELASTRLELPFDYLRLHQLCVLVFSLDGTHAQCGFHLLNHRCAYLLCAFPSYVSEE